MIERFQVAVLVTEEFYEVDSLRSMVISTATSKLLDHAEARGAAESVDYEWTHSNWFMPHHDRCAINAYGSDNYPRPIWLLVATMRAVSK